MNNRIILPMVDGVECFHQKGYCTYSRVCNLKIHRIADDCVEISSTMALKIMLIYTIKRFLSSFKGEPQSTHSDQI